MIEELVGRVFAMRNVAHREHWKTRSYAAHMALGALYEGLPDLIDGIVESYQGQHDLIELDGKFVTPAVEDCCEFLKDQAKWIAEHREDFCDDSTDIENQVDSLLKLLHSTIYKLEFLK